jgi:hypothetical protein
MNGEIFTIWSVRAATLFYVTALAIWLGATGPRASGSVARRTARLLWTAGCFSYLAHVYGAFEYFHGWSHAAAYAETARQTAELFGLYWGGGLFFNYAFTIVWVADVIWSWRGLQTYERRSRWISAAMHAFLAFMFFNGAVVFASGFSRWLGLAATPVLLLLWWRSHASSGEYSPH